MPTQGIIKEEILEMNVQRMIFSSSVTYQTLQLDPFDIELDKWIRKKFNGKIITGLCTIKITKRQILELLDEVLNRASDGSSCSISLCELRSWLLYNVTKYGVGDVLLLYIATYKKYTIN